MIQTVTAKLKKGDEAIPNDLGYISMFLEQNLAIFT